MTDPVARLAGFLADMQAEPTPPTLIEMRPTYADLGELVEDLLPALVAMRDDWRPIDTWTQEDGSPVLGYWHFYDQAGRLTEGWETIERGERGWEDQEGTLPAGLYTHFKPLTRPSGVEEHRR